MSLDSAKNHLTRLLPLALVFAQPAQSLDKETSGNNPKCTSAQNYEDPKESVGMEGFRSNALLALSESPSVAPNALKSIQPTFDDGPHPNDLALIEVLNEAPFKTAIFYYVGENFYNAEGLLDAQKAAIAKRVLDSGYEIGFHGMSHPKDAEAFRDQIESFETLIRESTGHADFEVRHIRPLYGAWSGNSALEAVAAEQGAETRTWDFSSLDWEVGERSGSALLSEALRAAYTGKSPDILFHSQWQNGSTSGSFGQMVDAYTAQVDSLHLPERQKELQNYRELLEALLMHTELDKKDRLTPSSAALGSTEQVLIDTSYNRGFESTFQGTLQSQLIGEADGYIGGKTVKKVQETWPDQTEGLSTLALTKKLRDPNQMLMRRDLPVSNDLPSINTLKETSVSFANRGLQVRKLADDLLCRPLPLGDFLRQYRLGELFVDEEQIPVYEKMEAFLSTQGLDPETRSRILATAILESGVKNNLDRTGLGKGTLEAAARWVYDSGPTPELLIEGLRSVGQKKVADTLSFGPHSIGPGQVPIAVAHAMFESILGRALSNEEVTVLLDSPEGTAFGIYLMLRQTELRLQSIEL